MIDSNAGTQHVPGTAPAAPPRNVQPPESPARPGWRGWLDRVLLPVHWSFLLSQVALWSFLVLLVTGCYLALFYRPGTDLVVYQGSAELYAGTELPHAFASTLTLSADVVLGEVARRVHRVATFFFLASVLAHLLRVLLTGAFRWPRRGNYLLGGLLLLLGIITAYTGHVLPFDMVAGVSLQIAFTLLAATPLVGEPLAVLLFGGVVPETSEVLTRAWVLHLFVLPALLVVGIVLHLAAVAHQRHTRLPEHAESSSVPVRSPVARFVLVGLLTGGVLLGSAALVPWGAIELAGPFRPGETLNHMEPDWYLSWAQGAMLIVPAIQVEIGPVVLTNALIGGALLPTLVLAFPLLYPWIEPLWRRQPGRRPAPRPDLAQHPFADPVRFGLIIAWLVVFATLAAAAAVPVLVEVLAAPLETVVGVLRVLVVVLPVVGGLAAWWYARREGPRWHLPAHQPLDTGEREVT